VHNLECAEQRRARDNAARMREAQRRPPAKEARPTSAAGSFARAAFTQDVSYDLAESDTVAFQALRLKIMKATNESITVAVLSGSRRPLRTNRSPTHRSRFSRL
jgi:hypothetical protein